MSKTRNERKRNREQVLLYVSVAVWAVLITALLSVWLHKAIPEDNDSDPVQEAPETQETAVMVIPPKVVVAENAMTPEEPELDKLPMIENATMTHYCLCEKCCGKEPDHPAYGITASGRAAEPYKSVAVDPFLIELGSTVYVDYGDGVIHEYRADDTGSGVAGAHIDLCVSSHEEALELGIKTVKVWYER